jgi:hypothetical protein
MTEHEMTITIPVSEAAQRHIEGLQATLTKRNQQIENLQTRLEEALIGEPNQAALGKAYQRGWKAAANLLMGTVHTAARALGEVNKEAFQIYLKTDIRDQPVPNVLEGEKA